MRGNPLIRLILVVLCLAGAGLVVGRITGTDARGDSGVPAAPGPGADAGHDPEGSVAAYAQIRLSSSAKRMVLDGERIAAPMPFDFLPGELVAELEFPMALHEGRLVANVIGIEWSDLSQSNFAHLTIEPEGLETRELTLHFPAGERTAAVDLRWPHEDD